MHIEQPRAPHHPKPIMPLSLLPQSRAWAAEVQAGLCKYVCWKLGPQGGRWGLASALRGNESASHGLLVILAKAVCCQRESPPLAFSNFPSLWDLFPSFMILLCCWLATTV